MTPSMSESSQRSATGTDGSDGRRTVDHPPGDGPARRRGRLPVSKLVFPVLLVLAWVVLTCIGLSGTSIGVVVAGQTGAPHDSDLVAGTPRPIRSDEWNVATPLIVAQSHHGFSRYTVSGLGPHDLTVVLDIPNRDWSTAFRPWDVPMLVLDVAHGFAARWWAMSLILILGAYLLLLELTSRTDIAVVFSLGLWLSPFFHWWYESISLESVGMPMLGLVFLLYALRARSRPGRILCLLASTRTSSSDSSWSSTRRSRCPWG